MQETGIDIVGKVPWGTHFCQFYQNEEDLLDILIPYFQQGLIQNEFCMWITCEPVNVERATAVLSQVVPDLDNFMSSGQIEILDYRQWYVLDGKFDADRVLNRLVECEEQALRAGYDGLRLTDNTFWLEEEDWNDFSEYERRVNEIIGTRRMIALCNYNLPKCGALELLDVVKNHEVAIVKRDNNWEILESERHKHTVSALKESENRYHSLFENLNESYSLAEIICDESGWPIDYRFLDVNGPFEQQIGFKRADVIGKTMLGLFPQTDTSWIETYGNVALTREAVHFTRESKIIGKFYDVIAYSPVEGQFAAIFTDVTERKRAEEEVRSLAKFPDENPNPIFRVSPNGTILYANPACHKLLGEMGCSVGVSLPDLLVAALPTDLESGAGSYVEIPIDEKTFAFEIVPITGMGYINLYGRDITERIQKEEHLRKLNIELERSNRDMEAFAYAASHDLQAPLRTIVGFLTLLQRRYGTQIGEKGNELVGRSVGAAERLQHLVMDLLAFSRSASRELNLNETPLGDIAKEVIADLHADLDVSGGVVTCSPLPELPVDRTQMGVVFRNLIANAIKFHKDGVPPQIYIIAEETSGEWVFRVQDNGIGFDPALSVKLFQPFKRLHTDEEYPGTGIGLAIVKRIVERHGGRVWADSEIDAGSTFYFTLPVGPNSP